MIEGLLPYAEYKESGQEWLGVTPAHWKIHKAGQIGLLLKGSGGSKADDVTEGLPCVRYGQLYTKYRGFIHEPKGFIRLSHLSRYTAIQYGDVLFAASGEKVAEIGKSAVNLIRTAAVCGGDIIILRPRMEVCAPFLGYALDSYGSASQKATMCRGSTIKHIYPDELRLLVVPLPPPDEQAAIVRFLDHANPKIDGFIRAKRKLIALLGEQKQAIIHRAVTRGLDANVPLKPSGIAWLGAIPRHWEVRKIKSLVSSYGGMTPSKADAGFWEGSIPWVSPKDMKVREISDSIDHISIGAIRQTGIALVQPPAVLIVVRGMILARTFPTAITAVPVTINQDMKALVTKACLNANYFVSLLTGIQSDLLLLVEIAGHGTCCLRTDSWEGFCVPIPPLAEQEEIEAYLNEKLSFQNTAITRTHREIALMQEYRTRLTADVVTGKLDVREAAMRLPDLPTEGTTSEDLAPDEANDLDETASED